MMPSIEGWQKPGDHTLIGLRLRLNDGLWRLAAGWAFVAGLLQALWSDPAAPDFGWQFLTTLVLGLILADALWGAIWAQATVLRQETNAAQPTALPAWPYASPQAAGTRMWAWLTGAGGHSSRDVWLALLLAVVLAVLLGQPAVLATIAVALLVLLGAVLRPVFPGFVRLIGAVVCLALPWWLGYQLFAGANASPWPTLAQPLFWFLPLAFTLIRFALDQKHAGASWLWLWAAATFLVAGLALQSQFLAAVLAAVPLLFVLLRAGRLTPARLELGCWLALWAALLGVILA